MLLSPAGIVTIYRIETCCRHDRIRIKICSRRSNETLISPKPA